MTFIRFARSFFLIDPNLFDFSVENFLSLRLTSFSLFRLPLIGKKLFGVFIPREYLFANILVNFFFPP